MFSKLFLVLSLALYCGVFLVHGINLGDGLKTEESSANGYGSNADGYGYGYSERALKKGKKDKKAKRTLRERRRQQEGL